jgi:hypothetical protein
MKMKKMKKKLIMMKMKKMKNKTMKMIRKKKKKYFCNSDLDGGGGEEDRMLQTFRSTKTRRGDEYGILKEICLFSELNKFSND